MGVRLGLNSYQEQPMVNQATKEGTQAVQEQPMGYQDESRNSKDDPPPLRRTLLNT